MILESPRLSGAFAHGFPGERFLYLSWKRQDSDPWAWRIKVPLNGITWPMLRGDHPSPRST
jgi:hypothetical protein